MTTSARAGVVLLALLSIGDIAVLFLTDGKNPPYVVAAICAVLGVASLAVLPAAWRGRRTAKLALSIMRVASALTAVPAFFVDPGTGVVVIVAAIMGITALGVALVQRPGTINVPKTDVSAQTAVTR